MISAMISIELFFLVNAALNAWMLILALRWLDAGKPRLGRVALAAALGGVYACAAWMNAGLPLRGIVIALAVSALMARMVTSSQRLRVTVKAWGFILAATALTGGIAFGVISLIPSAHPMLATALACVAAGLAARGFVGSRRKARLTYGRVHQVFKGNQWAYDAAVDTGNQAIDPVSGLPVVVMRHEDAARLYPALKTGGLPEGMRLIPVRTVSGTALLPCFTPEAITWNEQPIRAAVAVAPRGLITVALAPSCLAEPRRAEFTRKASGSETMRRTPA